MRSDEDCWVRSSHLHAIVHANADKSVADVVVVTLPFSAFEPAPGALDLLLLVGTNDLRYPACEVYWGVRTVISAAHATFPAARIVVTGILPRGDELRFKDQEIATINGALRQAASVGGFLSRRAPRISLRACHALQAIPSGQSSPNTRRISAFDPACGEGGHRRERVPAVTRAVARATPPPGGSPR